MSENTPEVLHNNVASPSVLKSHNSFLELTDSFFKNLDNFEEIVQLRGDVFSQKKEKLQQFIDYQNKKMEKEEEFYKQKTVELNKKIKECKIKLKEIANNILQQKKNSNEEKIKNETLKEKISELQKDFNKFNNTSELYLQAINQYKDFLNISIDFDSKNSNIVNITFLKCNNCEIPQLRLEILNNNKFKVLTKKFFFKEIEIPDETISIHDVMLLLYNIQKNLNQVTELINETTQNDFNKM